MRMIVPPLASRRIIDRGLSAYFRTHKAADFRRAVGEFCRFYAVKRPRIEWYEYIDWGKTAGKTYENGRIHLIHPENWKRGRKYKTERMWIQTFYHEMGHFLFWTDAERKADKFTRQMVRGLRRSSTAAKVGRDARPANSAISARRSGARRPTTGKRQMTGKRQTVGRRQASRVRSKVRVNVSRRARARSARS
ncbi:MAG TPA: hypothetical protein VGY99_06365 [Candidatus Binataceae bacterium]|nr:hypothetical protein [Candidatus Binataceae bacterium]